MSIPRTKTSCARQLGLLLIGFITLAADKGNAQAPSTFESGESALTIDNPHPTLFSTSKIDGFDYLEATIDVENNGASISWAPFLVGDNYNFLRETRLQLSHANSATSVGLAFKYNPFNPRGNAAERVFKNPREQVVPDKYGLLAARIRRIQSIDDQIIDELGSGRPACVYSDEDLADAADSYNKVVKSRAATVPDDVAAQIQCILSKGLQKGLQIRSNVACLEDQLANSREPSPVPNLRCPRVGGGYIVGTDQSEDPS